VGSGNGVHVARGQLGRENRGRARYNHERQRQRQTVARNRPARRSAVRRSAGAQIRHPAHRRLCRLVGGAKRGMASGGVLSCELCECSRYPASSHPTSRGSCYEASNAPRSRPRMSRGVTTVCCRVAGDEYEMRWKANGNKQCYACPRLRVPGMTVTRCQRIRCTRWCVGREVAVFRVAIGGVARGPNGNNNGWGTTHRESNGNAR